MKALITRFLKMLSYENVLSLQPTFFENLRKKKPKQFQEIPVPAPYWVFYAPILANKLTIYLLAIHYAGLLIFHLLYGADWASHKAGYLRFFLIIDIFTLVLVGVVSIVSLALNFSNISKDPFPKGSSLLYKIFALSVVLSFLKFAGYVYQEKFLTENLHFIYFIVGAFPSFIGKALVTFWISTGGMAISTCMIALFMIQLSGLIPNLINFHFLQTIGNKDK